MESWWGPLAAFGSSVTWTLGAARYAVLSSSYSAAAINTSRALVALAFLVPALVWVSGGVPSASAELWSVSAASWGYFTISAVASLALGDVVFFGAMRRLGVPTAMAIASGYPVWSALVGVLFYGESLVPAAVAGHAMVVVGVALVILRAPLTAGAHDGRLRTERGVGIAFAFATSFFWALNTWAVSRGSIGVSPVTGNVARMSLALVLCPTIAFFARGPRRAVALSSRDLKKSFPAFFLEGVCGTLFFYYGLRHSPLAVAATLSSLSPALSYGLGLATRRERFDFLRSLGIFLVIIGLAALLGFG